MTLVLEIKNPGEQATTSPAMPGLPFKFTVHVPLHLSEPPPQLDEQSLELIQVKRLELLGLGSGGLAGAKAALAGAGKERNEGGA